MSANAVVNDKGYLTNEQRILGASPFGSLLPAGKLKTLGLVEKTTKGVGSRFIVTEGGTTIIENSKLLQESFKNAGFSKFTPKGSGMGFNLPNGMDARVMQSSCVNQLRISFNRLYGTRITAEGVVPQKPFGMTNPAWKLKLDQLTHVNLK